MNLVTPKFKLGLWILAGKMQAGVRFLLQVGKFYLSMDLKAIRSIWADFKKIFMVIPVGSIVQAGAFFQFANEKWCSLNKWIFFLGLL